MITIEHGVFNLAEALGKLFKRGLHHESSRIQPEVSEQVTQQSYPELRRIGEPSQVVFISGSIPGGRALIAHQAAGSDPKLIN